MSARSFEDLVVWQKAHAYALEIYKMTEDFPKSELFGLTAQMRRAAVSNLRYLAPLLAPSSFISRPQPFRQAQGAEIGHMFSASCQFFVYQVGNGRAAGREKLLYALIIGPAAF